MTGKERIYAVMRNSYPDTVPWVPFAGVHAGRLKGYSAREVSTELDKLVESLLEVNRIYKPDGQPVMFDLQIEAEMLGLRADVGRGLASDGKEPPLKRDPMRSPTGFQPPARGRLALELEAMKRMKSEVGETTALYGLLCGPFTLASHLRGTNIFMDMIMNPDYVHKLLAYTNEVTKALSGYFVEAGMDVVAAVDPLISQISPAHFAEFMAEPFSALFDHIRDLGAFSSFFVCGNATNNIEPMCGTGPDNISVDENVDLATAKAVTDRYDVVLAGNIPLTSVMLFGNQQDNMKGVIDLMDSVSHDNLIISPGCDMPYATPIENTIAAEQAVHNTEVTRVMVANYTKEDLVFEGELPDYENLEKPLIEVFTLDSATCAACTYMLASAMDAQKQFGDAIEVVEYKYTIPENIARCGAMGVKQLPSIYINGKLKYSSIIPSRDELFREVEALL